MYRVVIDAGVFVSALLSPTGAPAEVVKEWLAGSFELIASPRLIDELEKVLKRPKLRRYITEDEAAKFVAIIKRLTVPKRDPEDAPSVCRDPNDDYLFALAEAESASFIVSGDADVLSVSNHPVSAIKPTGFLQRLRPD